mgnify:CR=1 FL=1
MGTPFSTDYRLSAFTKSTEKIAIGLIELLAENYKNGYLSLGTTITENYFEKAVFYTITDSEFENEFLTFKYKNSEDGCYYEIIVESRHADSPSELIIRPDDFLIDKLPNQMISEMSDKYYAYLQEH